MDTSNEAPGSAGKAWLEALLPGFDGGDRDWKPYLAATVQHVAIAMAMVRFADGPEAMLDAGELVELIEDCVDKRQFREELARAYCAAIDCKLTEWLGIDARMRFEREVLPQDDGGATGVIVAKLPPRSVRALFVLSACDGHATLGRAIRNRAGRHGGIPERCSAELRDWVEKPLRDWTGHELGVLLAAFVDLDVEPGTLGRSVDFDALPAFRNSFSRRRFERKARIRRQAKRRSLDLLNNLKFDSEE